MSRELMFRPDTADVRARLSRMNRHLWTLLEGYLTRSQRSEAALARAIEVKPQTLSSWKHRGFRVPPEASTLRRIATVTGTPYSDVLTAVLRDTGYLESDDTQDAGDDPLGGLSAGQRALLLNIVEELRRGPDVGALADDALDPSSTVGDTR
jgi:transcriptional regulator with XRE-family HTH domain